MKRRVPRATWGQDARKILKDEWWSGTDPDVIARRLAPLIGISIDSFAIRAQACFMGYRRSPEVLSAIRRTARLGKGGKFPAVIDPVPPRQLKRRKIEKGIVFRGLGTSGPDPRQDAWIAQKLRASIGRV
jgi:hypothetical protein